jgi:putative ABC transport system permease protein
VRALDRKLLRDLVRLRGQVFTIALVIACGIAQLVTFVTLYRSLEASRDTFYGDTRFGDVFVRVDRAPRAVLPRIEAIPGVARVDGRVAGDRRWRLPTRASRRHRTASRSFRFARRSPGVSTRRALHRGRPQRRLRQ